MPVWLVDYCSAILSSDFFALSLEQRELYLCRGQEVAWLSEAMDFVCHFVVIYTLRAHPCHQPSFGANRTRCFVLFHSTSIRPVLNLMLLPFFLHVVVVFFYLWGVNTILRSSAPVSNLQYVLVYKVEQ